MVELVQAMKLTMKNSVTETLVSNGIAHLATESSIWLILVVSVVFIENKFEFKSIINSMKTA